MYKDNLIIEDSKIMIDSSLIKKKEKVNDFIEITDIEIDSKKSKELNINKGKYITIFYNKDKIVKDVDKLINTLKKSIEECMSYMKINKKSKILFVGLGNKSLSCDKLGYSTIEKIVVSDNSFKIYKDVEGLTNINTYDFIKSLKETLDVDLVFIIDSLKAENYERLGSTIQLSTAGIKPGSATYSSIKEISKKTLKCEVLSLGVPSIINIKNININNPNMLVTTNDIDEIIDYSSTIISFAINRLF